MLSWNRITYFGCSSCAPQPQPHAVATMPRSSHCVSRPRAQPPQHDSGFEFNRASSGPPNSSTGGTGGRGSSSSSSRGRVHWRQAGDSSSSSSSSSTYGTPQRDAELVSEDASRLLRAKLQHASDIVALQDLWQQHQQQFNSFHFSVLMQQLTKLHDQVNTAIAQAAPQQQQQRHTGQQKQQRSALADLEQELGHLLHGDSSKQGAATAAAATSSSGSSSGTNSRPLHSRGLAELCPALDGYEHIVGDITAQAQQQPRSRRTQQPQPQLQTRLGSPTSSAAISGQQLQRPLRPPQTHNTTRQQHTKAPLAQQQPQPLQQQQQQQQELLQIHNLARAAAAAAVTPSRRAGLDDRSLVMVAHNLAKMQLHDAATLTDLLKVLGPTVLPRLDAQQLTNLIWSVGTCASSAQGDRSPYQLLVPPVGGHTAAAGHTASTERPRFQQQQQQQQGEKQRDKHRVLPASEKAAPTAAGLLGRDAVGMPESHSSSSSSNSGVGYRVPASWLSAAADSLLVLLPQCSSQGVSMALWGFAQAGYSPPEPWWQELWAATEGSLQDYSPQNLALTMCAVGKLGPQVPSSWLSVCCSAACEVMPLMSSQQLTMCLWGLASAGASPHKAFVLLWCLTSMGLMNTATTQELSMWLYSLALLDITPSPTWCAAFVEASFTRFTAQDARPQDLVTAMWSISSLGWSPPLLYWRGLMDAAQTRFDRFGPQDLANCISAAASVDTSCVSDAWLSAFLKASQPRLSAFEPVQLAHTANSLAIIARSQQDLNLGLVNAAWQGAFVQAAAQQLEAGRFGTRNLSVLVRSLQVLSFESDTTVQQFLEDAQQALEDMV